MIEAFVERVLLRRVSSRTAKAGWAVFLLAGPLAFFGGSILERRGSVQTGVVLSVDRDGARATAQQFAADRGIDTSAWTGYVTFEPSEDLLQYYKRRHDAPAEQARSFSPPAPIRVLLASDKSERAQVYLDQNGRVIGFDFTHVKSVTAGNAMPEAQAAAMARESVEAIPSLTQVLSLGQPDVASLKIAEGCRGFTWKSGSPALPGLSFEIVSAVCGTAPVKRTVKATVDDEYARTHWVRAAKPLKFLVALYGLYMTVLVIYSIYRYARRSMEREISHGRTVALAFTVCAAMTAAFLSGLDEYVIGMIQAGQGIVWYPLIFVVLGFLVLGLGVAVAYGAGEGDLRELYPGKMTSLDALFRGKLFSRNVARSALFGTAYAAWMLLAEGVADWAFHTDSGWFSADLMKVVFFRAPLLAIFAGRVVVVTMVPASALLLPLAFLGRNVRRPRLRTVLMLVFAVLGCLMNVKNHGSFGSAAVATAVLTATVIGAFFGMDLLAVIFGVGAYEICTSLARMTALSPEWVQLAAAAGVIGLFFIVAEAWTALHGKEYCEEEVRPAYAGNIVKRQQMQAELAAAREAQLHLLPKAVPEIAGLFITAACIPARIVGGDFYDFYPLDDSRLGIFIAEGGDRGIGAALNIALAKGFLMHTVRRNLSPRDVVQRLESTLGPLLEGAGTHVAYAVIDTAAGTIRYARTGDYPRVVVASALSAEHKVEIPGTGTVLYEGGAKLRTGDTVLLFTDGIARRVRTTGPTAPGNILKALARKHREYELEDDLTAVVVRVTRMDALSEVVA